MEIVITVEYITIFNKNGDVFKLPRTDFPEFENACLIMHDLIHRDPLESIKFRGFNEQRPKIYYLEGGVE